MTNLAGVYSEVAAYEFTTLTTVPGMWCTINREQATSLKENSYATIKPTGFLVYLLVQSLHWISNGHNK